MATIRLDFANPQLAQAQRPRLPQGGVNLPRIPLGLATAPGEQLAEAGQALVQFAAAERQVAQRDEAFRGQTALAERLFTLQQEAGQANLRDDASASAWWAERSNQALEEVSRGLSLDREAMSAFRAEAGRLVLARGLNIRQEAFQRGQQARVADTTAALEALGNQAALARNPVERQSVLDLGAQRVRELEESGAITPIQAQALRDRFQTSLAVGSVRAMMAQGNLSAALAAVNDPQVTPGLDADRRMSMVLQIQGMMEARAARAEAQMARRERAAERALGEFNGLLAQGIVPTDRAERMLAQARGTPFEATARQLVADAGVIQRFVTASPAAQAEMIAQADARRRGPNASDLDQALYARLTQVRENLTRAYDQNGIGASVALGVVPPLPALNWSDPATLAARVEAASGETARLGRRVSPFTRDDLVAGVEQFVRATPEQRLGIIQALGSMGDGAERARVIGEFERARGDAGRMPAGSVMRIFEMMQAGTPQAMLAARRLAADLGADVSDRARAAGERPEFNAALDSAQQSGVQAVLREQARIAGGGAYAGALNLDMDLIRRTAQVRIAGGETPTEAIRNAQAEVSAARMPLRVSGVAEVVVPAGTATDGLGAGFRALRERVATVTPDAAAGAQAGQLARERAAAARSAVWINAGEGFALVVPGIPTPLARATLDEVRAAGTGVQQQRQRETQPRPPGQQRTGRMLPPAQTDAPMPEIR